MREKAVTSYIADKITENKKSNNSNSIIIVTSFMIIIIGLATGAIILLSIGIMALIYGFINNNNDNINTYKQGQEGEEILKQKLHSLLSDDYIAYFGYPLNSGKDIDCVLLGPSGLYIIEVKHHNGDIFYTDSGWKQIKKGQKGTIYYGSLKNPGGQVLFALRELKSYLENKGIKIFIHGVIIFTHPLAVLSIERDTKPLIICKVSEIENLLKNEKNKIIPQEKVKLIEKELNLATPPNFLSLFFL